MASCTAIAIAQVAATVIGAAVTFVGQKKAAKAAKRRAAETTAARRRTEALQKRREDIIAARQRRRSFAEARRFRGGAVNLAAVRGVGGAIGAQGSIVPGVTANIAQQLNANNAFINQVTALNTGIRAAQGAVADIAGRPITAGSGLIAFGGLLGSRGVGQAFSFFGGSGGPTGTGRVIGGPSQPPPSFNTGSPIGP
jgi:hypothetical protein